MENKRGSLSTVFLVIAIILIVVMGALMYMQKTEADRQIAELENNASELQETINNLQGKIDGVSNIISGTTEEIKFDVEIEMSELENVNYSDNAQLKTLEDKYKGKIVKITGYVTNFGNDDLEPGRTYVNIGNSTTYNDKIYAGGMTDDSNVKKQIDKLEKGQKISIIGVAFKAGTPKEGSWPMILNDIKIIEEQADAISDNTYSIEKIIMWTPNTTSYDFNTKQWLPNDTAEYYVATDKDNKLCIVDREKNLVKKFDIVITDLITSAYVAEWEKTLTIIQKDATAYDINITDFTYRQYQYASVY